jgi:hypothetical protein
MKNILTSCKKGHSHRGEKKTRINDQIFKTEIEDATGHKTYKLWFNRFNHNLIE